MRGAYTKQLSMKRLPSGIYAPSGAYSESTSESASWYDGADFHCGWETGTGIQNTGATAPEDAWTSTSGTTFTRNTSSALYGIADATTTQTAPTYDYVSYTLGGTARAAVTFRFRVKLTTNGMTTANNFVDLGYLQCTGTHLCIVRFQNVAGVLKLRCYVRDSTNAWDAEIGTAITVSASTEYQVCFLYDKAVGARFSIYDSTGTQVGTTQSKTTLYYVVDVTRLDIGPFNCSLASSTTYRIDNVYLLYSTTLLGAE